MNIEIGDKKVGFVFQGDELIYPAYIKDGLVLHYDFAGMGNNDVTRGIARDLSGNGNDGVLENFAYDEGSGYVDNGLEFDGVDDYVQGNEEMCFDSTNFSMSFVYQMIEEPRQTFRAIGTFGHIRSLIGFFQSNSLRVFYSGGGGSPSADFGRNFVDIYQPNHYTFNFDNVNLKISLYANGEFIAERDMVTEMPGDKDLIMAVLGGNYGSGEFTKQSIYSFRKYNRLLTPEEIAHNYKIDKHRFNIQD